MGMGHSRTEIPPEETYLWAIVYYVAQMLPGVRIPQLDTVSSRPEQHDGIGEASNVVHGSGDALVVDVDHALHANRIQTIYGGGTPALDTEDLVLTLRALPQD